MKRKPYSSDLKDAEWQILEPLIPPAKFSGRSREVNIREVINTIFYLIHSGCAWEILPHDFPAPGMVYYYFSQWRDNGSLKKLMILCVEIFVLQLAEIKNPMLGL